MTGMLGLTKQDTQKNEREVDEITCSFIKHKMFPINQTFHFIACYVSTGSSLVNWNQHLITAPIQAYVKENKADFFAFVSVIILDMDIYNLKVC